MLYLTFVGGAERTWHVGEKLPASLMENRVTEVQADGHELDYIKHNFHGIPFADKAVQKWRGDLAAFIADHLPVTHAR